MKSKSAILFGAAALAATAMIVAQAPQGVDVRIVGHILTPSSVEPSDDRVKNLRVPSGFRVQKFATDLGNPRILAVSEDGLIYVTRPQQGDCLLLADTDGDGRADRQTVVAKRDKLHGIAIHENRVYLATVKQVLAADRKPDGTLGELKQISDDLPDGGQHPNRTLAARVRIPVFGRS